MTARSDDTPARRNALVDRLKAPRKTDITTTIKRTVCIDSWLVTKGRSVDMQKKYNNDRQSRVDTETKRQLIIVGCKCQSLTCPYVEVQGDTQAEFPREKTTIDFRI